jgi:hypothetical protein
MNRLLVAFLIAPLAIPAIAFRLWEMRPLSVPDLAAIFLNSVVTYAGIFLFGIPAYLFLRARKWTTFWAAAIAGFIVAGLTCWLLGIVTSFLGGWDLLDVHVHLAWLRFALWPCGPLGALVATAVDRDAARSSREAAENHAHGETHCRLPGRSSCRTSIRCGRYVPVAGHPLFREGGSISQHPHRLCRYLCFRHSGLPVAAGQEMDGVLVGSRARFHGRGTGVVAVFGRALDGQLVPLRACLGPQPTAGRLVALRSSWCPCRHPSVAHCATRSSGEA